jgi:hypothetical protein
MCDNVSEMISHHSARGTRHHKTIARCSAHLSPIHRGNYQGILSSLSPGPKKDAIRRRRTKAAPLPEESQGSKIKKQACRNVEKCRACRQRCIIRSDAVLSNETRQPQVDWLAEGSEKSAGEPRRVRTSCTSAHSEVKVHPRLCRAGGQVAEGAGP